MIRSSVSNSLSVQGLRPRLVPEFVVHFPRLVASDYILPVGEVPPGFLSRSHLFRPVFLPRFALVRLGV